MNNRMMAALAVAALLCICAAPMLSEDSDGADSSRVSTMYIYHASFTLDAGERYRYGWGDLMFIEGSENDQLMDAYLNDPEDQSIRITTDDADQLYQGVSTRTTVNVYSIEYSNYSYEIEFNGESKTGELVLSPYGTEGISFFVKAGDTFRLTATCVDNEGEQTTFYLSDVYRTYSVDNGTFEMTFDSPTNLQIGFSDGALYHDVTYTASGYSEPNGSAVAYIAICATITILVLAVLIYAGMKPKWSK